MPRAMDSGGGGQPGAATAFSDRIKLEYRGLARLHSLRHFIVTI